MNPSRSRPRAATLDGVGVVIAEPFGEGHPGPRGCLGDGCDQAAAQPSGGRSRTGRRRLFGSTATTTAPREAHRAATGHASHSGARGGARSRGKVHDGIEPTTGLTTRRRVRPPPPGVPGEDDGTPSTRETTRRTFTSSGATGTPNAAAATARAVYGPIPGSASSAATVAGTRPPWFATIVRAHSRNARARRL